jgi:hypothetical protein
VLGIGNLADLENACREGRLRTAKGLGPGLEMKILTGIEFLRRSGGLRLIHHAGQLLEAAEFNLRRSHPELKRIALAGDYRRGCELVSELAIVAQTPEPGRTRAIELNTEIRLWLADQKRYGAALPMSESESPAVRAAITVVLKGAGVEFIDGDEPGSGHLATKASDQISSTQKSTGNPSSNVCELPAGHAGIIEG